MKKAVFLDVAPCRYCVNRRFGRTYRLHLQGRRQEEIRERTSVSRYNRLVQSAHAASLVDFFLSSALKMEAIRFSNRRLTQYLYGATSKKTSFFMTTQVFAEFVEIRTKVAYASCILWSLTRGCFCLLMQVREFWKQMVEHKTVPRKND